MHYFSILLFALTVNIDNLIVGIAYGIKKIKISFMSNLLIALITAFGTFISMLIGSWICRFLSLELSNKIGGIILICIGIYIILAYFKKSRIKNASHLKCDEILNNPEIADKDNSGTIEIRESVMLGLALSINNMGLGIGAGITNINTAAAVICTFLSSLVFFKIGCFCGKGVLSKFFGEYTDLFSGFLIIALGLYEMFI